MIGPYYKPWRTLPAHDGLLGAKFTPCSIEMTSVAGGRSTAEQKISNHGTPGALPFFILLLFLIKLLSYRGNVGHIYENRDAYGASTQPTPSQTLIYHTSRPNSRSKILIPDLTALITRCSQDPAVCGGTYGNIYRCIYHGLEGDTEVRAGVTIFFAVY
jgi:hypothetical protein